MNSVSNDLLEATLRCNRCGFCQTDCPVYRELLDESSCARGRIRLVKGALENEQEMSDAFIERLNRCALCMSCSSVCPSGIEPHRIILAARAAIAERKGLPWIKDLGLRRVLSNERAHGLAFAAASYAQRIGLTRLAPAQLLPPGIYPDDFAVSRQSFRSQVNDLVATSQMTEKVVFFVGCMIDHSLPNVGFASHRVLNSIGIDVLIPKDLGCCGLPLLASGDRKTARDLAAHNVAILDHLDTNHIITACASCGGALRNEYVDLLSDTEFAKAAEKVAQRTIDISAFIAPRMKPELLGTINASATYHDPCHLRRGQRVWQEPRQLLNIIPGIRFQEMNEAERCCGAGGSFQIFFSELAGQITKRKLDNVRDTNAEIVATACPVCIQRLQGGMRHAEIQATALHIIEVVDKSISQKRQTNSETARRQLEVDGS